MGMALTSRLKMWYKAILYALVTAPMVFFVTYMWVTYPDQVLLHSIGTAAMAAANLGLLTFLIALED